MNASGEVFEGPVSLAAVPTTGPLTSRRSSTGDAPTFGISKQGTSRLNSRIVDAVNKPKIEHRVQGSLQLEDVL